MKRYPALTLALVFMTLTLTSACQFRRFFCVPSGSGCRHCVVTSGPRCSCASVFSYYGGYDPNMYPGGAGARGRGGRRPYIEPEKLRKMRYERHPFSDHNMEQQTEMLTHMVRLDRLMS